MEVAELPWAQFVKRWPAQYMQDQHVTIIGPTDCGKTTLAQRLIDCRGHVVGLGVKYVDSSMEGLLRQGWVRTDHWSNRPRSAKRLLVWPKVDDPEQATIVQGKTFKHVLAQIYKIGKWCVWTDELRYLTHNCGMMKLYQNMYVTARSNKISLVSAAQRPAFVPLEAYSQATHLFLYRTGDERDLARLGGLNGTSAKQVALTVGDLPFHTFLHVNMRTGEQTISQVAL